jgi:hypothetical protein
MMVMMLMMVMMVLIEMKRMMKMAVSALINGLNAAFSLRTLGSPVKHFAKGLVMKKFWHGKNLGVMGTISNPSIKETACPTCQTLGRTGHASVRSPAFNII